jgi:hypothetical protein
VGSAHYTFFFIQVELHIARGRAVSRQVFVAPFLQAAAAAVQGSTTGACVTVVCVAPSRPSFAGGARPAGRGETRWPGDHRRRRRSCCTVTVQPRAHCPVPTLHALTVASDWQCKSHDACERGVTRGALIERGRGTVGTLASTPRGGGQTRREDAGRRSRTGRGWLERGFFLGCPVLCLYRDYRLYFVGRDFGAGFGFVCVLCTPFNAAVAPMVPTGPEASPPGSTILPVAGTGCRGAMRGLTPAPGIK